MSEENTNTDERRGCAFQIAVAICQDVDTRVANGETFLSIYLPTFASLPSEEQVAIRRDMGKISLKEVLREAEEFAGKNNEFEDFIIAAYNGGKIPQQTREEELYQLVDYLEGEIAAPEYKAPFSELHSLHRKNAWELLRKYSKNDVIGFIEQCYSNDIATGLCDPDVVEDYCDTVIHNVRTAYEMVTGTYVKPKQRYSIRMYEGYCREC